MDPLSSPAQALISSPIGGGGGAGTLKSDLREETGHAGRVFPAELEDVGWRCAIALSS
jgi:hypothetical protein